MPNLKFVVQNPCEKLIVFDEIPLEIAVNYNGKREFVSGF